MHAAALALLALSSATAQAAPIIDVYTMGQGDELFSAFGHAAICVTDAEAPRGRCYNYGTADFTTPLPLTWSFIRGRALFWVSTTDVPHMLRLLRFGRARGLAADAAAVPRRGDARGRGARGLGGGGRQVLPLSPLQRQLHHAHPRRPRPRHRRAAVARPRRPPAELPPVGARRLRRRLAAARRRRAARSGVRRIGAPTPGRRCSCRRSCAPR